MKKLNMKQTMLFMMLLFYSFSEGQTLLHYWNFNTNTSVSAITTPTQTNISGASLTANIAGITAIDFANGTGQNFSVLNLNARNADVSGAHLRFNDPIGSSLVFALPTTGYENTIMKFATRRSGSGAGTQVWSYSTDGTNYTFFTNITPNNGDPGLATLDFSSISAADNNPNFKLRVEFQQGSGGTVGNNRFDNFTAEGTLLAGSDTTAPTATFLPISAATNVSRTVNPTIAFNESVRLLNNDAITNTNIDAVVELRLNNASGTLVPFDATFSSNTISIVPTTTLDVNQLYYVALLANTIEDLSDNAITTIQSTAFTTAKPTVTLSVSASTGTESGTTIITVTATADVAVNGDQTLNLGVTGTNITAGDYTLSNTVITLLSGQTSGSATFTVVNDVLVEGSEIATLTISNPSSGIIIGTTSNQAITIADNDTTLNIDLSNYVRVGRYDLPEPTRTAHPTNNLLCQEASAVAYNWDTDTLFITADGSTSVTQVSKTGQLIDTMTMAQGSSPQGTDFYDTEGLTYIGGGQFVMSEERDRQLVKFTYAAGTTLTRANTQTVKIGTFVPNTGTEGLSYDPLTGGYIVLKEITPIGIFQTGVDFNAGTATNGSATTENSTNLFDPALLGFSDVADVFALSNLPALNGQSLYNNLLVLGQENAKVVNVDRNGVIVNSLTIVSDAGNPLDVASQQHEGLTMDRDGILYIVSENGGGTIDYPQLWVYAPSTVSNQAPTAIALTNTTTSILENSNTTAIVKVADISVTDDGLGTNALSLSGADANSFQISGSSLYIKAGTVLDFETKTSYSVTVNVDDTTLGSTPDASVNYTLTVTDVVVETAPIVSVSVTEAASWSSSTTTVAADWFEVTNNGNAALDITGWKVDDSSNSFTAALPLTGITSIAPGESVIFLETSSTNAATIIANFKSTWFGSNVPSGLQVGSYTGSGIGLSTGGDAVNLFNAAGVVQANISFGAATTNFTFNNAASLNNSVITTLSQVGVNDAFAAANDAVQIGSPGTVGKLFISEVAPWSSGNSPVGADWFEVTNTKAVAVDITGWKVDDNSQSPAAAVALNGITSINPGESVIFIETADLAGKMTAFLNNWFGTNPTSGLRIGNYTGSGIGLGTGGDQVNLYNGVSSTPVTSVLFGASPTVAPFTTFDNAIGQNSLVTPISQFSAVGTKGAFIAANSTIEIGSPGTIVTAPCPTITATATPTSSTICFGATTTVSVTATGGTLPYTVTGSPLTVGGGTYNYTITDAKGCTAIATATVISLPAATVNLSVSTNTASETAGTVVTVTATASAAVCVDETLSIDVTGLGITAADYTLSNATITIPSGATTGSVTFTVVSDNAVEILETAVLTISNPSSGITLGTTTTQNIAISDFVFTLQVLHASDFEGAVEAVQDAPRFAAIVDVLEDTYANTIKLSSGDNYIPGPFLSSGEDSSLSAALKTSYESYYSTTFTSSAVNLLPSIGRADISILNFIGIEASALGNHEFDLGTTEVRNIIRGANSSTTVRSWFGAQFPYLSSNLNFSADGNLSAIATTNRLLPNTSFMSNPTEAVATITNKLKLAPSTIIMKGGQKIGIVGATTQVLASISSPGATTVVGGGANDMTILAGIVQPVVDALIADGCNKIILLSHLQQIAFEKELAGKLTGVDIIMAGGSNTLMADANDRLRTGDVAAESYPFLTTGLDGKALALINTDGNYKYVGRLVVDFDADGTLIPSSINAAISGVYAADAQGLNDAWGANVANAYAVGTRGYQVQLLCNAIGSVISVKDGNLFGKTSVYLEGQRNFVRTQETNLGNVSAEANLWMAKFYDATTVISIKNGGGIRSSIGNVIAVGNNVTYAPPIANPSASKLAGDISQLDIENSLRFNNQLSLVTLTATGLRAILENAVNATTATATPGQFAQVAGVRYSYNLSNASGSKILNAVITDAAGNIIDTLVVNGVTVGNLSRTFRVVTLNFLAGGGDGYPFATLGTSRVDLNTLSEQGPAAASFTNAGSEQDAFAEYMKNQYSTTPYGIADTSLVNDCRIQRVPARTDNVLPPSVGTNGIVTICNSSTVVTAAQLFAALGGTPVAGGTWSPALAGAGVYTYTVTAPSCSGSASATVTVSVTDLLASATAGTISCFGGTTAVVVTATGGTAPYTGTGSFTVSAGSYTYTVTDANGCTSTTSGTVAQPDLLTSSSTITECDSYTWTEGNGNVYTESGTYTFNNTSGPCPVLMTLILTITSSSINTTAISACDSYTWNGTIYTESGLYTGTTTNCVTEKLNLTIVPSTKAGTNGTLSVPTGTTPTNEQLFAALTGTPDAGGTWSNIGLVYTYTVAATTPCTLAATSTVTVTNSIPTALSFCKGAKVSDAVGTSSLKFYTALTRGSLLAGTATLSTRTLYATQLVNGLESSPRVPVVITVNELPTVPSTLVLTSGGEVIKKAGNFIGTETVLALTATAAGSVPTDHYVWTLSNDVNRLTVGNTNVINVDFDDVAAGNTNLDFFVSSVSAAGCVSKTARKLTVTRSEPGRPKAIVLTDALLSGVLNIKDLSAYTGVLKTRTLTLTATENISAGLQASSYKWVLPAAVTTEATPVAGQPNTYTSILPTIAITLGNYTNETSYLFQVYAVNGNGTSLLSRDLTCTSAAPKTPAITTTSTTFITCATSTYTATAILGATYNWTIPAGATFVGEGSFTGNVIVVNFEGVTTATTYAVTCSATNGTGTSAVRSLRIRRATTCAKIAPEDVVAEDELSVIAYPNPSSLEFTIESSRKGATVHVYDMLGRLVEKRQATSTSVQVGRNYASGVYNVIVSQGGKSKTLKVIKK